MAIPFFKEIKIGSYLVKQKLLGQALPAGADARATVPLQPRLRRLRQDRLSGRDPEPPHERAGMLDAAEECGAPMVAIPAANR
jgi:hypothetical protein